MGRELRRCRRKTAIGKGVDATDQLSIEPRRADGAYLLLDRQVRQQHNRGIAQTLTIIVSAALHKVIGDAQNAVSQAFNDTDTAQRFQPSHVRGNHLFGVTLQRGTLGADTCQVVVDAIEPRFGKPADISVRGVFGHRAGGDDAADR